LRQELLTATVAKNIKVREEVLNIRANPDVRLFRRT
jgi:hypothetical protein